MKKMLFSLLLFLFPRYLKDALRKGLFKTYIRSQYNDNHVAGSMDIPRHISKNTPFVGNVAYSQREYSYDNALTELVRHTIEFIQRKPGFNRQTFATKAHKAHNITGAITGVIALQNDLLFLNIRGIMSSFRENKNAFLFQLTQGFIGDFVHKALDRSKVTFGQWAIVLNSEQFHL